MDAYKQNYVGEESENDMFLNPGFMKDKVINSQTLILIL